MRTIWPGKPYPRGATWDGQGVNFAIFSEHATRAEVCLFDSLDQLHESERITLPDTPHSQSWEVLVDTSTCNKQEHTPLQPGEAYKLQARSLALLICSSDGALID